MKSFSNFFTKQLLFVYASITLLFLYAFSLKSNLWITYKSQNFKNEKQELNNINENEQVLTNTEILKIIYKNNDFKGEKIYSGDRKFSFTVPLVKTYAKIVCKQIINQETMIVLTRASDESFQDQILEFDVAILRLEANKWKLYRLTEHFLVHQKQWSVKEPSAKYHQIGNSRNGFVINAYSHFSGTHGQGTGILYVIEYSNGTFINLSPKGEAKILYPVGNRDDCGQSYASCHSCDSTVFSYEFKNSCFESEYFALFIKKKNVPHGDIKKVRFKENSTTYGCNRELGYYTDSW
jgi:hypothetical protein